MEVIFDPVLNCYYDPHSNEYYDLANNWWWSCTCMMPKHFITYFIVINVII